MKSRVPRVTPCPLCRATSCTLPAMTRDTSRTQPSSTLSARTRTGRVYCPSRRLDDGRSVRLGWVGFNVGPTGATEVAEDEVQVLFGYKGYRTHDALLSRLRKSGSSLFSAPKARQHGRSRNPHTEQPH